MLDKAALRQPRVRLPPGKRSTAQKSCRGYPLPPTTQPARQHTT